MTTATAIPQTRWLELALLYVAVPLTLALALPPSAMYQVLGAGFVVGLFLLFRTPDFSWRELWGSVALGPGAVLAAFTFVVASALCWIILPDRLWFILRQEPALLLMIAVAYPIILVIPQELVFRPLFFRRYGGLFPAEWAIWVNAALFSLAHLMYWHWAVLVMTFVGSVIFSKAYLEGRGFLQAVVLHSVAGVAIFASGLGWLFYSGGYVAQGG